MSATPKNDWPFDKLMKAAKLGDKKAMFFVAARYFEGKGGVEENKNKAYEWCLKAANKKHLQAMYNIACMNLHGEGTDPNVDLTIEWLKKAAELEHLDSMMKLAEIYYFGGSVDQDYGKMFYWLDKASNKGCIKAFTLLGVLFERGEGVRKNMIQAAKFFHIAAKKNDTEAKIYLAHLLEAGEGIAKNLIDSAFWFRSAADDGHAWAMYNLGILYYQGRGVTKDLVEAIYWLSMAAENKIPEAMNCLGLIYYEKKEYQRACEYFKQGIQCGNYSSLQNYLDTKSKISTSEQIFLELKELLKEADSHIVLQAAMMYSVGRFCEKDRGKAFELFKLASDKNSGRASLFIALMHKETDGENSANAFMWCQKAVEQKDIAAINMLGSMYQNGHGCVADIDKAIKFFDSIKEENFASLFNLAIIFASDKWNRKDPKKAPEYFIKAYQKNPKDLFWCKPIIDALLQLDDQRNDSILQIINLLCDLYNEMKEVISKHFSIPHETKKVVHFTDIQVLKKMLSIDEVSNDALDKNPQNNHLRLYSTIYANDPMEGRALINYSKDCEAPQNALSLFFIPDKGCQRCESEKPISHSCVYYLSATKEPDDLHIWRAYGKDGKGVGISIPVTEFNGTVDTFLSTGLSVYERYGRTHGINDKDGLLFTENAKRFESKTEPTSVPIEPQRNSDVNAEKENVGILDYWMLPIFKVVYGKTKLTTNSDSNKFNEILSDLKSLEPLAKLKQSIESSLWKGICKSVQLLMSPVCALCKDSAYSGEQEYRVIRLFPVDDLHVIIDDTVRESHAFHAYIQTHNFLFKGRGYEIWIGPKVQDKMAIEQELQWRLAKIQMIQNVEIKHSEIEYR